MKTLILEIYQMSPLWLCVLCAAASLGLCLLDHRLCSRCWWRVLIVAALSLWAVAVLYVTVLSRDSGAHGVFHLIPLHSYREVLATGNREILRSSFMNGLLFFPAGLLGAVLLPRKRRSILRLILAAALFSLAIELLQFRLSLGNTEMDDILHNTMGTLLGAWGYGLAHTLYSSGRKPMQ